MIVDGVTIPDESIRLMRAPTSRLFRDRHYRRLRKLGEEQRREEQRRDMAEARERDAVISKERRRVKAREQYARYAARHKDDPEWKARQAEKNRRTDRKRKERGWR